ncbi:MAG: pyruvate kinase [Bryobacteraceae bacterium]
MAVVPSAFHKTKSVRTIGISSRSREVMAQMIFADMNVARLNFSHGNFAGHQRVIQDLRAAARAVGRRSAIMSDLPGPKMLIGQLRQESVYLQAGSALTLTTADTLGHENCVSTTLDRLPHTVKAGDAPFLNDGLKQREVNGVFE